jgi:hypothetical protein
MKMPNLGGWSRGGQWCTGTRLVRVHVKDKTEPQRPSRRSVIMTASRCRWEECDENARKFETFMVQFTIRYGAKIQTVVVLNQIHLNLDQI